LDCLNFLSFSTAIHLVCPIHLPFYKIKRLLPEMLSRKQVPADMVERQSL